MDESWKINFYSNDIQRRRLVKDHGGVSLYVEWFAIDDGAGYINDQMFGTAKEVGRVSRPRRITLHSHKAGM